MYRVLKLNESAELKEKDTISDYKDYCKDKGLNPSDQSSKDSYIKDFSKWYAQYNGLATLKAAKQRVRDKLNTLKEGEHLKANRNFIEELIKSGALDDYDELKNDKKAFNDAVDYWVEHYFDDYSDTEIKQAKEDGIAYDVARDLGIEPGSEEENQLNGLYEAEDEEELTDSEGNKYIVDYDNTIECKVKYIEVGDPISDNGEYYEKEREEYVEIPRAIIEHKDKDNMEKMVYFKLGTMYEKYPNESYDKGVLNIISITPTQSIDTKLKEAQTYEDIEQQNEIEDNAEETVDSEDDQDENPIEEESDLDKELDEIRNILVDLDDIRLYKIVGDDDEFYILGKVSDNSNDVEMLVDMQPADVYDNPEESQNEFVPQEQIEAKFQFVTLPKKIDMIKDMYPKYGEELNPRHEELISYLTNLLIEQNPEAAEELNNEEDIEINEPENNLPDETPEELDEPIINNKEDEEDYE